MKHNTPRFVYTGGIWNEKRKINTKSLNYSKLSSEKKYLILTSGATKTLTKLLTYPQSFASLRRLQYIGYLNLCSMAAKNKMISVQGTEITIIDQKETEYISLTDMTSNFNEGSGLIGKWVTTKNTLEYLAIWESINNPDFNYPEFRVIEKEAGINRFIMSAGQWISRTSAIGLIVKAGRYGGTYAHKDIAFHFAMWLSPEFQIYLIKEFQRLKEAENNYKHLEWSVQRTIAKINYRIHTDAIKENLIPVALTSQQKSYVYADEADLLNVALFGKTAKQWRDKNSKSKGNIRDEATIEQLVVLSNLESINSVLIKQGLSQSDRLEKLNQIAISQMRSLLTNPTVKKLKQ